MKRLLALLICIILSAGSVCAAPSGMSSQPTDIKVTLHGKEIPSCAVNNAMYIAADDFTEYGYAVTYVDSVRTLFVNKVGTPSEIMPEKCDVKRTEDTDIMVIINGKTVSKNDTFAANGKMYVNSSAIAHYRDGNNLSDQGEAGYPNRLTSSWDGVKRIYEIEDAPVISKKEQIEWFISYNGKRHQYEGTFGLTEEFYRGENFDIVSRRMGGLPHGSSTTWMYFGDDGKSYSINEVLSPFRMHGAWGNSSISNPRIEGRRLYFEGRRVMNLAVPSEGGIYEGTYYLDLDTTVTHIVEEEKIV